MPSGYSVLEYQGDGVTDTFAVNFTLGYLSKSDIYCRVGDEVDGTGQPAYRELESIPGDTGRVRVLGTIPTAAQKVLFRRITPKAALENDYADGEALDDDALDNSFKQGLMISHELLDGFGLETVYSDIDMAGHKITGVAIDTSDPTSLVTIEYAGLAPVYSAEAQEAAAEAQTAQGLAEEARDAAIAARDALPAADDILVYSDIGDTVQSYGHANVRDYGAVGDGIADDTAAFVALALLTGTLYVPAGAYKLTSPIKVLSNQRWVLDPNAVIDATALATSSIVFSGYGTKGSTVALSSNAASGATSVVVDSVPAGCVAGAMVRIACNTIFDALRTNSKTGEMALVLSVAGTTVTLASTLACAYLTSASATLSVITPLVGFSWSGGKILGNGSGQNLVGMAIARAYRPVVEDITMDAVETTALQFIDCMGGVVRRPAIHNASSSALGYGVSITSACKGVLVEGGLFYNCRHATTTTCSATQIGIPVDITFKDCQAFYTSGDCFDTHCPAWNIRFINCIVHRTAGSGFNIECPNASIIDCIVYSATAHAASIINWADVNSSYNISNLRVVSCGSDGVRASQGPGVTAIIDSLIVRDCNINAAGLGVYVFSTNSQINQNVRITGNKIRAELTNVVYAEQINNLIVAENTLIAAAANGNSLRIRDCLGFNVVDNTHVLTTGSIGLAVYLNATGAASCTQGTVSSQRVMVDADGADLSSARGLVIDNNATNITVGMDNDFTLTGTPFIWGSGTGHSGGGLYGSAEFNPGSLDTQTGETTTVTVTGAALGMKAEATFSLDLQGVTLTAYVRAANTVAVRFQNDTGGTLDLESGTLRVLVTKIG